MPSLTFNPTNKAVIAYYDTLARSRKFADYVAALV